MHARYNGKYQVACLNKARQVILKKLGVCMFFSQLCIVCVRARVRVHVRVRLRVHVYVHVCVHVCVCVCMRVCVCVCVWT